MSITQSLSRAMRPCDDVVGLIGEAVLRKREADTLDYWIDIYTRHDLTRSSCKWRRIGEDIQWVSAVAGNYGALTCRPGWLVAYAGECHRRRLMDVVGIIERDQTRIPGWIVAWDCPEGLWQPGGRVQRSDIQNNLTDLSVGLPE